jgi:hypothetical protein
MKVPKRTQQRRHYIPYTMRKDPGKPWRLLQKTNNRTPKLDRQQIQHHHLAYWDIYLKQETNQRDTGRMESPS